MATTVTVSLRATARVHARHLWIYRSDLVDTNGARGGELVHVIDARGHRLGSAFYSDGSQIALRMVAFGDRRIDRDFWLARLVAAETLRGRVVEETTAFRLVYGESDLLPSLIVDRYTDCLSIQTLSQGMEALKSMWIEILVDRYAPRAIVERNDARVRELEGLPRRSELVYGENPGEVVITEAGVRFAVDLLEGQKTGAFLDQRENRIAAGRYAVGRGLDCFAYNGGFAMHMAGKSNRVMVVDSSGVALAQARRNASLNGFENLECIEANAFDLLREMELAGEKFDVINLDPPAFAKSRRSVEAATRGYKEINLRAMRLLSPGGMLITSSCSYHISEEAFLNILVAAAADSARTARILERRSQGRDHPVLLSMPETSYLKCVVLSVD